MQDFKNLPVFGIDSPSSREQLRVLECLAPSFHAHCIRLGVVLIEDTIDSIKLPQILCPTRSEKGSEKESSGDNTLIYRCRTTALLKPLIADMARRCDIVMLIGNTHHLGSCRILLADSPKSGTEHEIDGADYKRNPEIVAREILEHADRLVRRRPVWACILIGGKSSRMGRPKHLLTDGSGRTWLEKTVESVSPHLSGVALSGMGEVPEELQSLPRLVDIPGVAGPVTGIVSATRWLPDVSWLLLACDMPGISAEAIEWLLTRRRLGRWAVVPRLPGQKRIEPLFAIYEPQSSGIFSAMIAEGVRKISSVADFSGVHLSEIPPDIKDAWSNVNTPEEFQRSSRKADTD